MPLAGMSGPWGIAWIDGKSGQSKAPSLKLSAIQRAKPVPVKLSASSVTRMSAPSRIAQRAAMFFACAMSNRISTGSHIGECRLLIRAGCSEVVIDEQTPGAHRRPVIVPKVLAQRSRITVVQQYKFAAGGVIIGKVARKRLCKMLRAALAGRAEDNTRIGLQLSPDGLKIGS